MRFSSSIATLLLLAALMAANAMLDRHQPYPGAHGENSWLLLVSNLCVFSADLSKHQADVVYHGGV